MGRIRTIKPELLDDERTACLSHEAFRLFVGMILLADDHGNLRATPRFLDGKIFWAVGGDNSLRKTEASMHELEVAGLVRLYDVREQKYAHLNGWGKHQRVDKPGKEMVPPPEDVSAEDLRHDFLYMLRRPDGAIKIGRSFNPRQRAKEITTQLRSTGAIGKNDRIEIIASARGGHMERELHRKFARHRLSGEWFTAHDEVVAAAEVIGIADDLPDEPVSGATNSRGARECAPNGSRTVRERGATDQDQDQDQDQDPDPEHICPAERAPSRSASATEPPEVDQVVEHYVQHHPRAKPGKKERRLVRDRLRTDGYTVEDLCRAIDGCHASPYHSGANDTGTKYQSLELIVRDSKHVTQFLELYDQRVASKPAAPVRGVDFAAEARRGAELDRRAREEAADGKPRASPLRQTIEALDAKRTQVSFELATSPDPSERSGQIRAPPGRIAEYRRWASNEGSA